MTVILVSAGVATLLLIFYLLQRARDEDHPSLILERLPGPESCEQPDDDNEVGYPDPARCRPSGDSEENGGQEPEEAPGAPGVVVEPPSLPMYTTGKASPSSIADLMWAADQAYALCCVHVGPLVIGSDPRPERDRPAHG